MDRRKVYISRSATEKEFSEIACDCHMHEGELRYKSSADRYHSLAGEITNDAENGFTFSKASGYASGEWEFKELTLPDFRRKYYKLVVGGEAIALTIKTTADLHEWFRKEFKI